ncbi:hypothetical protein COV23_01785 [Candidatus Wolfebacteria bacterium CG10_big_fil_rev_8_21_14_0_10_31_9]|uniref:HTH cro/C1-type domain-containing protein n=1 Tax=Candidatus Wolfebacteria bacterium CG10_big_fil_rev_8_21_14_0_10_31_9 TaxID=1975070 RepID=A0A2H0RC32_9BACT|nr:MAG: hypothetical protein COV23_01785 [Candidatus Wolfebacteria bacterium CG10_big_fil_rev_8_21_14_0_10_31_9]
MSEEIKTIKDTLNDVLSKKGLTQEKLAEISDVPEYYMRALYGGNYKELPPEPYVRGYIIKIANSLEIDGEALWDIYKKTLNLKTSGEADKLPVNRFAISTKRFSNKKWIILIVICLILGLVGFQVSKYFGTSSIDISNPPVDDFITTDSNIILRGKIDPQDSLTIKGENVSVDKNGYFEKEWSLSSGPNLLEFKVKRLLGKEVKIERQIIYQP